MEEAVIVYDQSTLVGGCGHQDPSALGDDQELFVGASRVGMGGPGSLSICRLYLLEGVERGQAERLASLSSIHGTMLLFQWGDCGWEDPIAVGVLGWHW